MISNAVQNDTEHADWICPSDRHLQLRAKLRAGWSVRTLKQAGKGNNDKLSGEELEKIRAVIARAEKMTLAEQKRIGNMVHDLESMRGKALGDGQFWCILCAEEFGKIIGASYVVCADCNKKVCSKCSVPYTPHSMRRQARQSSPIRKTTNTSWLCKICSESREVWKRSGAWFFRSLPKYILPEAAMLPTTHKPRRCSTSGSTKKRLLSASFKNSTPVVAPTVTYSHVGRRRSSSSDSSDEERHWASNRNRRSESRSHTTSVSSTTSIVPGGPSRLSQPLSPTTYKDESPGASRRSSRKRFSFVRRTSRNNGRSLSSESESNGAPKNDVTIEEDGSKSPVAPMQQELSSLHSSGVFQPPEVVIDPPSNNEPVSDASKALFGTIEFSLFYETTKYALHVTIIKARNLRSMDINGYSDPYVKMHIFPGIKKPQEEATKMRTKTKKKTLNPDFNETLTYWGITTTDIERKRLRLMMQDEDTFGHNEFLGEVLVPLRLIEPYQTKTFELPLERHQAIKEDEDNERGRMLIALCYEQRNSILVVTIQRCSGLLNPARGHNVDPQIKACLQVDDPGSNEMTFRKTDRRKATRSPNPMFSEEMRLPLPGGVKELVKCRLDVTVWDRDALGRDHLIGGLMFGINSKGDKLHHWFHCVKNPSKQREMWHSLVLPDDPGRLAVLSATGKRRRSPKLSRKRLR
uniref:Rabphilin-3A n=1 Tax=Phallusia mammillata TaxID=59560 RepID=A0A6F9DUT1_9ASCI|nr:rabphilin-3A [Phallusia mammillata]